MALKDYIQLEYIESTGTQYIDTGYKHNTSKTIFDMKVNISSLSSTYNALFGARIEHNSSDAYYIGITNNTNHTTYTCIGGTKVDPITGFNIVFNTDYIINIDPNKGITVNDTLYSVRYTSSTISSYNDYIFGFNSSGLNEPINMKLYYFKITENNNIIRDMIPVKRKSDNVIGLYDKISKQFFINKGSGTFIAGPEKDLGSQLQQNIVEIQDLMSECNDLSLDILGGAPVPPTPTQKYIELKYITGTGTQYINTDIGASSIGKLTTKFKINNVVSYSAAMAVSGSTGYFGSDTTFGIGLTTNESQNGFWYCSKQNYSFSTNTLYDIEMLVANGSQTFKVNDTTYNTTFSGTPTSNKLYLFTMNYAGNVKTSEIAKIDLYRTKIYSNDKTTLLRDLIPCKRVSDNVICMYDKISDTFFLNKGTGSFVAGPEAGYTELEYIQSSRTQFIDTGISTNVNVGFEIDFQVMDTRIDDAYFGARNSGVSPSRYGCLNYNNGFHMMLSGNAIWNYTVDTNRHKCSILFNGNSYTAKFDNNTSTGTLSATDSGNFGLFGYNYPSRDEYPRSAMRLYSAKLYTNNTTLVRDFIPVKRKENNVVCLYDKVSNTYFTNVGTGTFIAGPEIN